MRRILFLLFTVIVIFTLTSCKDSDPAPKTTLLTFTQDPSGVSTSTSDDWIFITDESGNILDNQPFEAGTVITLSSKKILPSSQKINVTTVRSESSGTIFLKSFLGISVGQTWTYRVPDQDNDPQNPGKATLSISNFPSVIPDMTFSDSNGFGLDYVGTYSSSSVSIQFSLHQTPTTAYLTSFKNNIPVLLTLVNAQPGSAFTADFNQDFKPLNRSVVYPFEGTSNVYATVVGLTSSPKTTLYGGAVLFQKSGQVTGPLTIGYVDGFNSYYTRITLTAGTLSKGYARIGPVPVIAPMLNYTASISNKSCKDFAIAISGAYDQRTSMWGMASGLTIWTVYSSPDGVQKFIDLPQEIKSKYPGLSLDALQHYSSTFTVYKDGFQYADFVNSKGQAGTSTKVSVEYQFVSIQG